MTSELIPTEGEVIKADDPQAISEAITPYFSENPHKTKYLSWRACAFTVRESERLTGISPRTRLRWRNEDSRFRELDDRVGELKSDLANQYIEHEFRRNFRMVLHLDYEVLQKEVQGANMTDREQKWLLRTRQYYTPQQLEQLQRILGEKGTDGEWDFTRAVLELSRGADKIRMEATRGSDA